MIHITSQQTIHLVIYSVIWWTIQYSINRTIQSTIIKMIHSQDDAKFDLMKVSFIYWFTMSRHN